MKLHKMALALAGGILWAGAVLFLAIWAQYYAQAAELVRLMGKFYLGFDVSILGILIGVIWGFADAFVGCYIFAWLYNFLVDKCANKA